MSERKIEDIPTPEIRQDIRETRNEVTLLTVRLRAAEFEARTLREGIQKRSDFIKQLSAILDERMRHS